MLAPEAPNYRGDLPPGGRQSPQPHASREEVVGPSITQNTPLALLPKGTRTHTSGCECAALCNVYLVVMRKHIESQWLFAVIDELYGFICILHRHYWKNWSKNFFLHHLGFRINVSKYCWG